MYRIRSHRFMDFLVVSSFAICDEPGTASTDILQFGTFLYLP